MNAERHRGTQRDTERHRERAGTGLRFAGAGEPERSLERRVALDRRDLSAARVAGAEVRRVVLRRGAARVDQHAVDRGRVADDLRELRRHVGAHPVAAPGEPRGAGDPAERHERRGAGAARRGRGYQGQRL